MTTSSGSSILQANQLAEVSAGAYSGGTIVFAAISGGMVLPVPGQVTALTIGTVTSSSVPLSWTAPGAGGPASGYTVNYRVTGTSAWAAAATAVPGLTFAVVGLSASTGYDFEVIATNATGSGPASSVVSTTTAAPATLPPGQPMGLSAGTLTSSSVALSWTAPSGGGAAAGYTVQYCAHGTGNWITAQTGVATALVHRHQPIGIDAVRFPGHRHERGRRRPCFARHQCNDCDGAARPGHRPHRGHRFRCVRSARPGLRLEPAARHPATR